MAIIKRTWEDRESIRAELRKRVPLVKKLAELNVEIIKDISKLDVKSRLTPLRELVDKWKNASFKDLEDVTSFEPASSEKS